MDKRPRISNEKRFNLIQVMQLEMQQSWGYSPEQTGIIITAFIGKIRKSIKCDSLEAFSEELYQICKPEQRPDTHSTMDTEKSL